MKLLQNMQYIDPTCVTWDAPKGSVVDGASIPRFAWSIIGGPFEGKYRNASVIHDVACDLKQKPWESVHEVFYNGMIASGVNSVTAKIMYAAVYHFGPRWPRISTARVKTRDVQSRIEESRREAPPDSTVTTSVQQIARSFPDMILRREEQSAVTVTVIPPSANLNTEDFEKLRRMIEEREPTAAGSMTLEEIRTYRPQP
jgi:hypothetical protein